MSLGQFIQKKNVDLISEIQCCKWSTKACFWGYKISNKNETKYINKKALSPSFQFFVWNRKDFKDAFVVITFSSSWFAFKLLCSEFLLDENRGNNVSHIHFVFDKHFPVSLNFIDVVFFFFFVCSFVCLSVFCYFFFLQPHERPQFSLRFPDKER